MNVFCGIDWAEGHHDIALVDQNGKLVGKRRINETVKGFAELTAMLAEAGDSEQADPGRDRDTTWTAGRGLTGHGATDLPDQPVGRCPL